MEFSRQENWSGLPFSSNFWSQRLYKLNPSVSEKETLSQDISPSEHTDDVTTWKRQVVVSWVWICRSHHGQFVFSNYCPSPISLLVCFSLFFKNTCLFISYLAVPGLGCRRWHLSSLSREQLMSSALELNVFTTGPPRKSPLWFFNSTLGPISWFHDHPPPFGEHPHGALNCIVLLSPL